MTIYYRNKQLIDNLNIHDSLFDGFNYNYSEHQISISCTNNYLNKIFSFKFCNVIYCKMQSCLFWGPGYNIYDIYNTKFPEEFIKQIDETKNKKPEWYSKSAVGNEIEYIAVEFAINSGDTLLIICESIDLTEVKIKDN